MAHILVIDDEEMTRFTIRDMLEAAGHEVTDARDGEEGVALQHDHAFDLIITDMIMPKKEGVETVIELKQANPNQKIVAISGGGRTRNMDFLQMAEQFGADQVLAKPFTEDELLESVDTCLSGTA